jgi:hypothetical protein
MHFLDRKSEFVCSRYPCLNFKAENGASFMWNKVNILEVLLNFFGFKTPENLLVLGSNPIKLYHSWEPTILIPHLKKISSLNPPPLSLTFPHSVLSFILNYGGEDSLTISPYITHSHSPFPSHLIFHPLTFAPIKIPPSLHFLNPHPFHT